jgi:hypothetical protein
MGMSVVVGPAGLMTASSEPSVTYTMLVAGLTATAVGEAARGIDTPAVFTS